MHFYKHIHPDNMNFKDYVTTNQLFIEKEKNLVLTNWKKSSDKLSPTLKSLSQLLMESNKGGKNIRGSLVCLGYELFTKKKNVEVYKIAAAYEILHTSLLIHDDVMDKSILRRGKPTVFQELGGDHYGISQAICLGDVGFFLATKIISQTTFSNEIKLEIISQFSQIVLDTITGQMLDIKLSKTKTDVSEKDLITLSRLKTAQYTIAGPLLLGAMIAGVNKKNLKNIFDFGENLGIAFQIKDDLLGIFGDEKRLGKSVSSDIEEGKNTLISMYARSHSSKIQKELFDRYYGKGHITVKEHMLIKRILKEIGSDKYCEKKIVEYTKAASLLIGTIVTEISLQYLLKDLINYLINRET